EKIHYQDHTYANHQYDPERKGKRNYQHAFAKALHIRGYPSTIFFDEDGNVIAPITGYLKPKEFEVYLKMMASDDYKKVDTKEAWEAYQKNFKHTFSSN